jgi:hypothetical protein
MTKPLIQIGDELREMNADEYAQHLLDLAEWQAQEEERTAKAAARQAVLNKLGLSAEEAAALLG